jgi:tRNA (cytidine32/uridine32-2'-O)-methyltransferase
MALDDIRIVLVEPAHPGNVGAVARAMKTMSLSRLVLVRPHQFPSEEANRRAMGSVDILERAQVVDDLDEAVGDCRLVIGGSARARKFPHSLIDARQCGAQLVEESAGGAAAALVFGPERSGLANHDLDRCSYQVLIPTSEAFSSLNLASAVQLVCYEIFMAAQRGATSTVHSAQPEPPASQQAMEYFYEHLERALDSRGYLDGEKREVTMMKLRRLFGRARPVSGELKMLRSLMRLIHRDGE